LLAAHDENARLRLAQTVGVLSAEEAALIARRNALRDRVIRVDDFSPDFAEVSSPAA
jgi:acyl-CoA dehydrogenase